VPNWQLSFLVFFPGTFNIFFRMIIFCLDIFVLFVSELVAVITFTAKNAVCLGKKLVSWHVAVKDCYNANYSLFTDRVLLQQCLEGFSSLYRRSNASQLPCLLRGEASSFLQTPVIIKKKAYLVLKNNQSLCLQLLLIFKEQSALFFFPMTVSVWLDDGHQCTALWAHDPSGMPERDESS
jgi:hypothetical protein